MFLWGVWQLIMSGLQFWKSCFKEEGRRKKEEGRGKREEGGFF